MIGILTYIPFFIPLKKTLRELFFFSFNVLCCCVQFNIARLMHKHPSALLLPTWTKSQVKKKIKQAL